MSAIHVILFALSLAASWSAPVPPAAPATSDAPAAPAAAPTRAHSPSEPDLSQGESTFDPAIPGALEVKKAKTGHLLVRPTINGRSPDGGGWFIFDTGAGICVVSTSAKDGLDLTDVGELDAIGVGGPQKTRMYRAGTVRLGPLTLKDHPVMITDLSFLEPHLGEKIAGVIGYGVLSRCVVEMSLADAAISLHDPRTYSLTGGAWETMTLRERIPGVRAAIEGREGRFRLDTGANSAVTIHKHAVEKWNLLEGRETSDSKLGGVGGYVKSRRATLREVTLGGVTHSDVRAELALEGKGAFAEAAFDGNIGAGLLSKYSLVLDYVGERICLRPLGR